MIDCGGRNIERAEEGMRRKKRVEGNRCVWSMEKKDASLILHFAKNHHLESRIPDALPIGLNSSSILLQIQNRLTNLKKASSSGAGYQL